MVAYYDQCYCTICHINCHINCPQKLQEESRSARCTVCRAYRYVLKSRLKHLLVGSFNAKSLPESYTNFKYLNTPEKIERMHKLICKKDRKITILQQSLTRLIEDDGVIVDNNTNSNFMAIMIYNTSTVLTAEKNFKSLFWQPKMKAKMAKSSQGIHWHPAIIRWCFFTSLFQWCIFHYQKFWNFKERTLRDYRHFAPAVIGFSTDTNKQLLDMLNSQQPAELAKYVSIIIDEMYVKELIFNKCNGCLIGFQDLRDIHNLIAEYENQHNSQVAQRQFFALPL